jgi:hypothetical protein
MNSVLMMRTSCQSGTGSERLRAKLADCADSVGAMATAASESAPQRIATIREQLKLLGDYL